MSLPTAAGVIIGSAWFQLSPGFYLSRYFIAGPYPYQLRPAGRFQRWIRYGDDLLLVNVRTGRVIQVIHNRYW